MIKKRKFSCFFLVILCCLFLLSGCSYSIQHKDDNIYKLFGTKNKAFSIDYRIVNNSKVFVKITADKDTLDKDNNVLNIPTELNKDIKISSSQKTFDNKFTEIPNVGNAKDPLVGFGVSSKDGNRSDLFWDKTESLYLYFGVYGSVKELNYLQTNIEFNDYTHTIVFRFNGFEGKIKNLDNNPIYIDVDKKKYYNDTSNSVFSLCPEDEKCLLNPRYVEEIFNN